MRSRVVITAVATVLAAMAIGAWPTDPQGAAGERAENRALRRTPVVEVFEQARDAVVNISSTEVVTVQSRSPFDSLFEDFFDMPSRQPRTRQYMRNSIGSGFVIHPDGYIVTNAHVVSRSTELKVTFADGREFDAQIVASDAKKDLAVVRIESDGSLPTLPLGRSDNLMIGETVIAIGNPLGYQNTVTAGVVSATGREVAISPEVAFTDLIQTDASINPGNSGGPLLNVLGELIGINTAIRGDAQNIGFAIPVDELREVLPELLDVERRYRIDSGLAVDSLAQPRVLDVRAGSPAERAGIEPGDLLLAVNSRPIRKGVDFDIALINREPGDNIDLTLRRGARQFETRLRLAERPAPDGIKLAREKLGIEIYPLPDDIAKELDLGGFKGVLITAVERGGPADYAGIERRDILIAIGRHHMSSVSDLGCLLETAESGDTIPVDILRVERRGKVKYHGQVQVR